MSLKNYNITLNRVTGVLFSIMARIPSALGGIPQNTRRTKFSFAEFIATLFSKEGFGKNTSP
ncbi:MAG: hypothetical protein FWD71_01695 [Oscillospiraceae bacterium]|nr:hypothetical protein [Oscillospiraceae bacterium]